MQLISVHAVIGTGVDLHAKLDLETDCQMTHNSGENVLALTKSIVHDQEYLICKRPNGEV